MLIGIIKKKPTETITEFVMFLLVILGIVLVLIETVMVSVDSAILLD